MSTLLVGTEVQTRRLREGIVAHGILTSRTRWVPFTRQAPLGAAGMV
jgi:hypothetical protein